MVVDDATPSGSVDDAEPPLKKQRRNGFGALMPPPMSAVQQAPRHSCSCGLEAKLRHTKDKLRRARASRDLAIEKLDSLYGILDTLADDVDDMDGGLDGLAKYSRDKYLLRR
jgi:hypothetical protein